jgi:hypothetical protein
VLQFEQSSSRVGLLLHQVSPRLAITDCIARPANDLCNDAC